MLAAARSVSKSKENNARDSTDNDERDKRFARRLKGKDSDLPTSDKETVDNCETRLNLPRATLNSCEDRPIRNADATPMRAQPRSRALATLSASFKTSFIPSPTSDERHDLHMCNGKDHVRVRPPHERMSFFQDSSGSARDRSHSPIAAEGLEGFVEGHQLPSRSKHVLKGSMQSDPMPWLCSPIVCFPWSPWGLWL